MSRRYRRRSPGLRETAAAAAAAVGAAAATFYLTRLLLAREPLPEFPPARTRGPGVGEDEEPARDP